MIIFTQKRIDLICRMLIVSKTCLLSSLYFMFRFGHPDYTFLNYYGCSPILHMIIFYFILFLLISIAIIVGGYTIVYTAPTFKKQQVLKEILKDKKIKKRMKKSYYWAPATILLTELINYLMCALK